MKHSLTDSMCLYFCSTSRYFFRSGNIETNGDRFYNTTVEVLPYNVSVMSKVIEKSKRSKVTDLLSANKEQQ